LVRPSCCRDGGVRLSSWPSFDPIPGSARSISRRGKLVHPSRNGDERRGDRICARHLRPEPSRVPFSL